MVARLVSAALVGGGLSISMASAVWAAPTQTLLYSFTGKADGANPDSGVIMDAAGNLYGTTYNDNSGGFGTVFKLTRPAAGKRGWAQTVLYRFKGAQDGLFPLGNLVFDASGNLYGATCGACGDANVKNSGTIFKLSPPTAGGAWTETVLYRFKGGTDGDSPQGGVIFDKAGNLYGTTSDVVANVLQHGTVFKLSPPKSGGVWVKTVLHRFLEERDGERPLAAPVMDASGNLFGTTVHGGLHNAGTVFELTPPRAGSSTWSEKLIHVFGAAGAWEPSTALTLGHAGVLFGTTIFDTEQGNIGGGVIFQLAPPTAQTSAWSYSVIHRFQKKEGGQPYGAVILDTTGVLYGSTAFGGNAANPYLASGTIFKLSPPAAAGKSWAISILANFSGANGATPQGQLAHRPGGAIFGTVSQGGASFSEAKLQSGFGGIFAVTP